MIAVTGRASSRKLSTPDEVSRDSSQAAILNLQSELRAKAEFPCGFKSCAGGRVGAVL